MSGSTAFGIDQRQLHRCVAAAVDEEEEGGRRLRGASADVVRCQGEKSRHVGRAAHDAVESSLPECRARRRQIDRKVRGIEGRDDDRCGRLRGRRLGVRGCRRLLHRLARHDHRDLHTLRGGGRSRFRRARRSQHPDAETGKSERDPGRRHEHGSRAPGTGALRPPPPGARTRWIRQLRSRAARATHPSRCGTSRDAARSLRAAPDQAGPDSPRRAATAPRPDGLPRVPQRQISGASPCARGAPSLASSRGTTASGRGTPRTRGPSDPAGTPRGRSRFRPDNSRPALRNRSLVRSSRSLAPNRLTHPSRLPLRVNRRAVGAGRIGRRAGIS